MPGSIRPEKGGLKLIVPVAITGQVNPFAIGQLQKMEYPTEELRSKSRDEFARPGSPKMDFIITVCDKASGEICPTWPGKPVAAYWGFEDPAAVEGTDGEKRQAFEKIFQYMMSRVRFFLFCHFLSLILAIKREMDDIGLLKDS